MALPGAAAAVVDISDGFGWMSLRTFFFVIEKPKDDSEEAFILLLLLSPTPAPAPALALSDSRRLVRPDLHCCLCNNIDVVKKEINEIE
jgi:hypothetical protein